MKLRKLRRILRQAAFNADGLNPQVEVCLGDKILRIKHIGQFGVVPDVVIELEDPEKETGC